VKVHPGPKSAIASEEDDLQVRISSESRNLTLSITLLFVIRDIERQKLPSFVAAEEMPGFDVVSEFVAAVGSQVERLVARGNLERNDVPEIDRDKINGEDIQLATDVSNAGLADDVAGVGSGALEGGGFDLHAEVAPVVLDANVVAGGVAVRASDAETAGGGSCHKTKLCPLAALLASSNGTPVSFASS